MSKPKGAAILAVAAMLASAAHAEVIEVTGEFAAPAREASLLRSLAVGRFDGEDGPALAHALERALEGGPFEIFAGRGNAEGLVSGRVTTGVDERSFEQSDKRCVEKNAKGKCVKEERVKRRCRRRIVNVDADIRIAARADDRILYSAPRSFREEVSWCDKEAPARTAEETVAAAIAQIAQGLRSEIVPEISTYRIRVRESTKGFSKPDASRFKALVKQTKTDIGGACAGWAAMQSATPNHPSLLFNLGLCAEQRGAYENALALYRDAAGAGAGEASEGMSRAERLIAGREDALVRRQQN